MDKMNKKNRMKKSKDRALIDRKARAVVLLSGGQDSTTCLYWAKQHFEKVFALSIFYRQRHMVELSSAKKIAKLAGVEHYVLFDDTLPRLADTSALLNHTAPLKEFDKVNTNLPASFVPGRNLLFTLYAAIWAYKNEVANIVLGVSQEDYSGYPDCRANTIIHLQDTIQNGFEYPFTIHTPIIYLSKRETVQLALSLPGCMDALAYSHTCYDGKIPPCGECPSCKLREKGFKEAGISDPLLVRLSAEGAM